MAKKLPMWTFFSFFRTPPVKLIDASIGEVGSFNFGIFYEVPLMGLHVITGHVKVENMHLKQHMNEYNYFINFWSNLRLNPL